MHAFQQGLPVLSVLKIVVAPFFRTVSRSYLSQKSLLHRVFGQLQRVVMLSGAEYDFRQGCTCGKGHIAWIAVALALNGCKLGTRHIAWVAAALALVGA